MHSCTASTRNNCVIRCDGMLKGSLIYRLAKARTSEEGGLFVCEVAMLTAADIQRVRDDLRIQRLQRLAANMRRTTNNGATRAMQQRDVARRLAALDAARRLRG